MRFIFGARIVQNWSDSEMARATDAAVGKIEAVVPAHLRRVIGGPSLWSPANRQQAPLVFDPAQLRAAIRASRKLRFRYRDEKGAETNRTVHPLMLCFYGPFWVAGAWCELRNDFRFFQLDRMRT
jgi:predicted DNA-binding transcriptional regulator YafY